jgi:ribosomal-protein-alanine N-acetyltransferase
MKLHLNFVPFPLLETDRLLLRQLTVDDSDQLFILRSDARVLQYLGKEPAKTVKEVEEFILKINASVESGESILWAITLKGDPSKVIGTICLWNIIKEHFRAEIGYVLHPGHWRKGFMKEAIEKVMEYGFTIMNLHSIEARLSSKNSASVGILEATGFVREGYFKEDFFFRDKFEDTFAYSKLNIVRK